MSVSLIDYFCTALLWFLMGFILRAVSRCVSSSKLCGLEFDFKDISSELTFVRTDMRTQGSLCDCVLLSCGHRWCLCFNAAPCVCVCVCMCLFACLRAFVDV